MSNESRSQSGGSGSFAADREKASEAGRKGGQQSHPGSTDQSKGSQQGGSEHSGEKHQGTPGNFKNDPEKASEAGRKGGDRSQDKR